MTQDKQLVIDDIFKQAKKDAERFSLKDVAENNVDYGDVYLNWFEFHLKIQFEKLIEGRTIK